MFEDLVITFDTVMSLYFAASVVLVWRKQKLKGPEKTVEPIDPNMCQCGHGAAFHDEEGCHVLVRKAEILEENSQGVPKKWRDKTCLCVRFVGPNSVYDPGLDADLARADKDGKKSR